VSDPHRLVKLAGVHPRLAEVVTRICTAMEALGFTMIVTDGVRSVAQQKALYASGRTKPGPIVTHLDGELKRSNHQTKPDGFGHAVDMCFVIAGLASWDEQNPWALYGAMAKSQGCVWGGDWKSIVDKPHIELPT
jgi:peptidoglycan L-alanyl-D-glutamate endopeptidase CwlK